MDDRRFDSLAKSFASGASRRSVLKGILGLGGGALAGGIALEGDADAARRPTPTPTPVKCPGQQVPAGGVCTCPSTAPYQCGPDCCTGQDTDPYPRESTHSECCDNECCFGTCYGEELCCATNDRPGELPPTHQVCNGPNGDICCRTDQDCCLIDGCCDTVCSGGMAGNSFCCVEGNFCPGADVESGLCCDAGETCCGSGTANNACVVLSAGGCCNDSQCGGDPCVSCHLDTHTCGPRCDEETETCCGSVAGPGQCVVGECCVGLPSCDVGETCCLGGLGTVCVAGEVCPTACTTAGDCDSCESCTGGFCIGGCLESQICCDDECLSVDEVCNGGECCPGGFCDGNGDCCPAGNVGCNGGVCCSTFCDVDGNCCESGIGCNGGVCCDVACDVNGDCPPLDPCEGMICLQCQICDAGMCVPNPGFPCAECLLCDDAGACTVPDPTCCSGLLEGCDASTECCSGCCLDDDATAVAGCTALFPSSTFLRNACISAVSNLLGQICVGEGGINIPVYGSFAPICIGTA